MIYCQYCLTQNEPNEVNCGKCGRKLMVLSRNQQWEEPDVAPVSMDEHFLERISRLEETVGGLLEHLSRLAESMEIQERNSFITRSGLSALIETLKETNLLREEVLNQRWETTISNQMDEAGARDRFAQMHSRFIALFRGENKNRVAFTNLIEEAEFLIYSDRSYECAKVLDKALELDPLNYELAHYLAEYYQNRGENIEALHYLDIALAANEDHADSLLMSALLLYSETHVEEAKRRLTRCIEVNPHNPVSLLSMGSILTAEGLFEEAVPFLMRANELEPSPQGYYMLGMGAKERGELKDAINFLKLATEMDPEHEDALFILGMAYLERGWTRKARRCFAKAQALNPTRLDHGETYAFDSVEEPGEEPIDAASMGELEEADALFREGKLKQALTRYRQLLKKYPDHQVILASLCVLTFSLQRYDETIRAADKILRSEDTSEMVRTVAYTMLMEALRSQSRYDEVIEWLTRMLGEFQTGYGRTIACYGLAMTKADMGQDLKEAEALAREAVELSPPDFRHNAMDALGWVYFKQGRYEEALSLLESALSMRESISHLYHYGMILLSLNLHEEAFKVFERTVKLRAKEVKVDDFIYAAIKGELATQAENPLPMADDEDA